jgi:hypothetical protein
VGRAEGAMVMRMVVEFTREVGPAEEGKEGKVGDTRKRSEPTVAGQRRPSTHRRCLPPTDVRVRHNFCCNRYLF